MVLVPFYKGKGDIKECENYCGIKLMSHTMKLWERAIILDKLTEEIKTESPWDMMFADDIVLCREDRRQLQEVLKVWRNVLEREA